jgi:hypothetical protein
VHDCGDSAILAVPPFGEVGQPGPIGGGKVAAGRDPKDQHVVVVGRYLEMDVQAAGGERAVAGDEEVFAIVVTTEIASPAGAQVTLDQARAHRLVRHTLMLLPVALRIL